MKMFYLENRFVGRQSSFYGKAVVVENNGNYTLFSYMTPVAKVVTNINGNHAILYDDWDYSMTTLNYVKEFLIQFNIFNENLTKSAINKALKDKNDKQLALA